MDRQARFGEILKELRTSKCLGQVALAKELGVSKGIISLWENNLREPSMSNLITLSEYFNISIDELVGIK
ncbi:MAG: helix-turn-helix transcriptional regulator [Clostridiales bacterium]|nr:helix-turn-helix transcriptional regulator [Clostridiales bacterium]